MTQKNKIIQPATETWLYYVQTNSPDIPKGELDTLLTMMSGIAPYDPMVGSNGRHLMCQGNGCRNVAIRGARERRCPTHYATVLQRFYAAKNERSVRKLERAQSADHKETELAEVATLSELKSWIKEYLL